MSCTSDRTSPRRVVLAFSPHLPWLRRVLRGVQRYADERGGSGGWELAYSWYGLKLGDLLGEPPLLGSVDGIIAERRLDLNGMGVAEVPTVALAPYGPDNGQAVVGTDMQAVGRMAAEHLLGRSLRRLAVFTAPWSKHITASQRLRGFIERADEAGVEAAVFATGGRTESRGTLNFRDQLLDLADFLIDQPHPLGLFAVDVDHAWRAMLACKAAGLRVPEDVALICGGEDEVLFDSVRPGITGILYDNERVGYEAAATLDAVMGGEVAPPLRTFPPLMVVERASTDLLAVADERVEAAVRFIWENVAKGLQVQDVVDALPVSARSLTRRFRQALGHSPADEIRRSRIETAKRLLTTTDLPLSTVAFDSGYGQQPQLNRYIKKDTGLTPLQLRDRHRGRVG